VSNYFLTSLAIASDNQKKQSQIDERVAEAT